MIAPIFQSQVKKLKNEPDENRDESHKKKIFYRYRKRRSFYLSEVYAVYYQNKGPPSETKEPILHKRDLKNKENGRKEKDKKAKVKVDSKDFFFHPAKND